MGFRNPITSAVAVDTGAGAIPGVKVYSDTRNPGSGVVEWDAYSARVLARLTSSQTGSGGTNFSLGLTGGPSLQLNDEAVAAGGDRYVTRLQGQQVAVIDNLYAGPWARGSLLNADGSTNLPGNNTAVALRSSLSSADVPGNWQAWSFGSSTYGFRNSTPGRYLIVCYLADVYNAARYEALSLLLDDGTGLEIASLNQNVGYGGLTGTYVYDAPNGPAFGFRFGGNASGGIAGTIRPNTYWTAHHIGELAAL